MPGPEPGLQVHVLPFHTTILHTSFSGLGSPGGKKSKGNDTLPFSAAFSISGIGNEREARRLCINGKQCIACW